MMASPSEKTGFNGGSGQRDEAYGKKGKCRPFGKKPRVNRLCKRNENERWIKGDLKKKKKLGGDAYAAKQSG